MSRRVAAVPRIVPATDADIEAVAAIVAETWHATYAPLVGADAVRHMIAALLRPDELRSLAIARDIDMPVALIGKTLAGTALARHRHDSLHILRLYVSPRFQGRGVGRALLDWLAARQPPDCPIHLEVAAANTRALRFYRDAGFIDRGGDRDTIAGIDFDIRRLERPGAPAA